MLLDVLLYNAELVAIDKPPEVLSVPGRMGESDPRPCAGRLLETQLGARLYPVHRLDFEVSGILLFAKSTSMQSLLNSAFENRSVEKTYQAWTLKNGLVPQKFSWQSKIVRGKKRSFEAPHGKEALTDAQVLRVAENFAFWHLTPKTGRPHQLRLHLMKAGFPILGDELYGGSAWPHPGIALRHVRLEFSPELAAKLNLRHIECSELRGI